MIKFFRQLRQHMIKENRVSKYLLYAIGEIVLVVIGILFALQINNWNTHRQEQLAITNYYERIHEELHIASERIDKQIKNYGILVDQNRRTLAILNSQNRDSIPALEKTLGSLGTMWTMTIRTPVTDEFLDKGYLSKIDNDSLKFGLVTFTYVQENIRIMNAYTSEQYNNTIEPFFNKHVNYSAVAMERYKSSLVMGGPSNDYEALFNSLELWNIVTFKLENLSDQVRNLEQDKKTLNWLVDQVLADLEHRRSN